MMWVSLKVIERHVVGSCGKIKENNKNSDFTCCIFYGIDLDSDSPSGCIRKKPFNFSMSQLHLPIHFF